MKKTLLTILVAALVLSEVGFFPANNMGLVHAETGEPTASITESAENHANPAAAQEIPAKTKITGETKYGSADYYKYIATQNGYVQFYYAMTNTTNDCGYYRFTLYDDSAKELEHANTESLYVTRRYYVKAGTTFYLSAEETDSMHEKSVLRYSIYAVETGVVNMELESNDSMANATNCPKNKTINAMINSDMDVDYFKFKAKEAGTYKFIFDYNADKSVGYGWDLALYNKKGKEVKRISDVNVGQSISKKMKKGEVMYLKVTSFDDEHTEGVIYSITVK